MTNSGDKDSGHIRDIRIEICAETVEDGKDEGCISRLKVLTRVWFALFLHSILLFYVGLRLGEYALCAGCGVAYALSLYFYTKYAFFVPDIWRDGLGDSHRFEYRRRMNVTWWKLALIASLVLLVVSALLHAHSLAGLAMFAAVISFFILVASLFRSC